MPIISYFLFAKSVMAQGGVCNRSDFAYLDSLDPTAPTPIKSIQPRLSDMNTAFDNVASNKGIVGWVMKAIANKESGWRQIDVLYPNYPVSSGCNGGADGTVQDCACVSGTLDYGVMQLNWGSNKDKGWDWNKVLTDYTYHIERGADVLIGKSPPLVNDGNFSDAGSAINWYLKLWAYNAYKKSNNPSNGYNLDRNWNDNQRLSCQDWPKAGLKEGNYTYQERVLYLAWCRANHSGFSWGAINMFPLPDDDLFGSADTPTQDILIFEVQPSLDCANERVNFIYTLDTAQSVTTQITIRDNKPWNGGNVVQTLPIGQNQWDITSVSRGSYWFTVNVKNSSNDVIGLQSWPVEVGCQTTYLPVILKQYSPPQRVCYEGSNHLQNTGFESPLNTYWIEQHPYVYTLRTSVKSYNGSYSVVMGGLNNLDEKLFQTFTLPNNIISATVTLWLRVETTESSSFPFDTLEVDLLDDDDSNGQSIVTPIEYSNNFSPKNSWRKQTIPIIGLDAFQGQTVRLHFRGQTDSFDYTYFFMDDITFTDYYCD